MEEQTKRVPKRLWSEEDKRIRKEMVKIELQRLEEEKEALEKRNQRFEEEEEKMSEERQQNTKPSKLTDEQRKIRRAISRRSYYHRIQLAKAAKDENYKQKLEARRQRGEKPKLQTPRNLLRKLTAEQKKIRQNILQMAHQDRRREREKARYHRIRAEKIQSGEIKPKRIRRKISQEANQTAHTETATEEEVQEHRTVENSPEVWFSEANHPHTD